MRHACDHRERKFWMWLCNFYRTLHRTLVMWLLCCPGTTCGQVLSCTAPRCMTRQVFPGTNGMKVRSKKLEYYTCASATRQWKSQIAHLDMHHPVTGINALIHSVSLASHVSTRFLIHLSAHLCHHPRSHHPSLLRSFTPGSKPIFSTNPSELNTYCTPGLPHEHETGPELSFFSISF